MLMFSTVFGHTLVFGSGKCVVISFSFSPSTWPFMFHMSFMVALMI